MAVVRDKIVKAIRETSKRQQFIPVGADGGGGAPSQYKFPPTTHIVEQNRWTDKQSPDNSDPSLINFVDVAKFGIIDGSMTWCF